MCRCPLLTDFNDPELIIPTNRLWQFIEESGRKLRKIDTGWAVAMSYGVEGGGHFGYQLENQASLKEAISFYSTTISGHASVSHGKLEATDDSLWFYRATIPQKGSDYFQVEQYALGTLVHIVKSYLGDSWRPRRIAIASNPGRPNRLAIAKSCGELITNAERAAIEVPLSGLDAKPVNLPNSIKEPMSPASPFPAQLPDILTQMLKHYVPGYPLTLTAVSDILEIQPRTLNRRLEVYDMSFRDIRKKVLVARAKIEIEKDELSMGEISKLLGYSNQSAFSRAFSAVVGISPMAFRERISAHTKQ
jgi:AraC-like DNA-binding protein